MVGAVKFEHRIRELTEGIPDLAEIVEPLLDAPQAARECCRASPQASGDRPDNEVCRLLTTIPGVGPVVALAYTAPLDTPARFRNSKAVRPILGLTPVPDESGESRRIGRISCCGDGMMRTLLYEATQTLLTRVTKWSWLTAWARNVAKRRGRQKAVVALARRLAVIMHRMWRDGTKFHWTRQDIMPKAPDRARPLQLAAVRVAPRGQVAARWPWPLTTHLRAGGQRKGRSGRGDGRQQSNAEMKHDRRASVTR